MNPSVREFAAPVLAGAVLHVLLYVMAQRLDTIVFPIGSESSDHPLAWLLPWTGIAHSLLPGLLSGYLALRRPMVCGAMAAFVGGIVVTGAYQTYWQAPISIHVVGIILLHAAQSMPFGLVSGAAGFLLRRHAIKLCVQADRR
jgi:hypothetical protein